MAVTDRTTTGATDSLPTLERARAMRPWSRPRPRVSEQLRTMSPADRRRDVGQRAHDRT